MLADSSKYLLVTVQTAVGMLFGKAIAFRFGNRLAFVRIYAPFLNFRIYSTIAQLCMFSIEDDSPIEQKIVIARLRVACVPNF